MAGDGGLRPHARHEVQDTLAHLVIRQRLQRCLAVSGREQAVATDDLAFVVAAADRAEERSADRQQVRDLLRRLDARTRDLIVLRFGLDGGRDMTCRELGRRYGMTGARRPGAHGGAGAAGGAVLARWAVHPPRCLFHRRC